jgi:hypothetical protein
MARRKRRHARRTGRTTFKAARRACAKKHGISKAMWKCVRRKTGKR